MGVGAAFCGSICCGEAAGTDGRLEAGTGAGAGTAGKLPAAAGVGAFSDGVCVEDWPKATWGTITGNTAAANKARQTAEGPVWRRKLMQASVKARRRMCRS